MSHYFLLANRLSGRYRVAPHDAARKISQSYAVNQLT